MSADATPTPAAAAEQPTAVQAVATPPAAGSPPPGGAKAAATEAVNGLLARPEAQKALALLDERPELAVGLAFIGGIVLAKLIRSLGRS